MSPTLKVTTSTVEFEECGSITKDPTTIILIVLWCILALLVAAVLILLYCCIKKSYAAAEKSASESFEVPNRRGDVPVIFLPSRVTTIDPSPTEPNKQHVFHPPKTPPPRASSYNLLADPKTLPSTIRTKFKKENKTTVVSLSKKNINKEHRKKEEQKSHSSTASGRYHRKKHKARHSFGSASATIPKTTVRSPMTRGHGSPSSETASKASGASAASGASKVISLVDKPQITAEMIKAQRQRAKAEEVLLFKAASFSG